MDEKSGKMLRIRKNAPEESGKILWKIRKNTPENPENPEKYSRKSGKILPKKQDPVHKITFSDYGCDLWKLGRIENVMTSTMSLWSMRMIHRWDSQDHPCIIHSPVNICKSNTHYVKKWKFGRGASKNPTCIPHWFFMLFSQIPHLSHISRSHSTETIPHISHIKLQTLQYPT